MHGSSGAAVGTARAISCIVLLVLQSAFLMLPRDGMNSATPSSIKTGNEEEPSPRSATRGGGSTAGCLWAWARGARALGNFSEQAAPCSASFDARSCEGLATPRVAAECSASLFGACSRTAPSRTRAGDRTGARAPPPRWPTSPACSPRRRPHRHFSSSKRRRPSCTMRFAPYTSRCQSPVSHILQFDPQDVGHGALAPRHQAGEPHGAERAPASDRCVLRAGAAVAVAQAVDLGNMMLVLALRSDPEHVYEMALSYFTPEELAEAFAATRGVASPSQLRASMKADGRGCSRSSEGSRPRASPSGSSGGASAACC